MNSPSSIPHPPSSILHSAFCILHSALCIVPCALCLVPCAFFLLCPSARAVEIQAQHMPASESWIALMKAGTAGFWENIINEHASALNGDFTAVNEPSNPAESGHQLAIICNAGGFAVFLRFDCDDEAAARGGTTEIYFCTDESAAEGRHPPRHIILHPGDPNEVKMVPDLFGASCVVEARKRPDLTKPYIEEEVLPGGYATSGPLKHVFAIHKAPKGKGWYTSIYINWSSLGLELPFFPKTARGTRWRLKVIRHAADGSRYIWGADERPYAGYGFVKWPAFPAGFRSGAYKQWIVFGLRSPAASATEQAVEYWRVSPLEAGYKFLAPKEETFQPREPASDTLFLKSCLQPYVAANEKMLAAFVYTGEKGFAPAFNWSQEDKDRFFSTEFRRLYSIKSDVDEMRRRYVLDRLLGREVKLPAPKSGKKAKRAMPDASDFDAVGNEAPEIDLDDEPVFSGLTH